VFGAGDGRDTASGRRVAPLQRRRVYSSAGGRASTPQPTAVLTRPPTAGPASASEWSSRSGAAGSPRRIPPRIRARIRPIPCLSQWVSPPNNSIRAVVPAPPLEQAPEPTCQDPFAPALSAPARPAAPCAPNAPQPIGTASSRRRRPCPRDGCRSRCRDAPSARWTGCGACRRDRPRPGRRAPTCSGCGPCRGSARPPRTPTSGRWRSRSSASTSPCRRPRSACSSTSPCAG
jgi:hypothetical protein